MQGLLGSLIPGPLGGIVLASATFTWLHLGFMSFSPVAIISGTALWASIGTLYYWSKSLYLVGMFHGVANALMNASPQGGTEVDGLIVNALLLLLIVVVTLRKGMASHIRPGPA